MNKLDLAQVLAILMGEPTMTWEEAVENAKESQRGDGPMGEKFKGKVLVIIEVKPGRYGWNREDTLEEKRKQGLKGRSVARLVDGEVEMIEVGQG